MIRDALKYLGLALVFWLTLAVLGTLARADVRAWKPPKYWEGAPLRNCQRWLDGGVCCGYRATRGCAYVVCNGEVVVWSCVNRNAQ